jgi:SAM-dependent methyltransferase
LHGKIVIDIPAGNGVTTEILLALGCKVEPYDLFPEYFLVKGIECRKADINEGLPLANNYADFIICQEGIEHFNDQLKMFREFSRVLKLGGKLIITTFLIWVVSQFEFILFWEYIYHKKHLCLLRLIFLLLHFPSYCLNHILVEDVYDLLLLLEGQ